MLEKELHHKSVMIEEVLSILKPSDGETYIDCTLGAGGHAKKILESADCKVIGIDKDSFAIDLCKDIKEAYKEKFYPINGDFGELGNYVTSLGFESVDGILLDLGLSSMQLSSPDRGFSFQHNSPLDMRMSQKGDKAYDLINSASESSLANIIYTYGEEHSSRKIAKEIINQRKFKKIETTFDLIEVILRANKRKNKRIHPATKTFQAIRIYINDELRQLYQALLSSEKYLSEGGKLIVISFHSLEDRIVKNFIRDNSVSKKKYDHKSVNKSFVYETRKVLKPSNLEIKNNRRSRSAKLRWVYRSSLSLGLSENYHNYQEYGGVEC